MFNEYYARDTSRKIRSTFQSKGKSGKHLTGTVIYGYYNSDMEDYIKTKLIESLFKFRLDR